MTIVHQGPFFDGVHSRCGCRLIVQSAQEWAEHVTQKLGDSVKAEIIYAAQRGKPIDFEASR